jgi:hypothetical protein
MEESGKTKAHRIRRSGGDEEAVDPVMAEYAKEIGADAIYNKINSM